WMTCRNSAPDSRFASSGLRALPWVAEIHVPQEQERTCIRLRSHRTFYRHSCESRNPKSQGTCRSSAPDSRFASSGLRECGRSNSNLQDVDVADGTHAYHVGEADAGAGVLALTGLAAQLAGDFRYLANAGRTDGMAHADQATRGIHRALATNIEGPFLQSRQGLTRGAQAHALHVFQLFNGEGIVQFHQVQVGGADARLP